LPVSVFSNQELNSSNRGRSTVIWLNDTLIFRDVHG
jgi:hypothetical protein